MRRAPPPPLDCHRRRHHRRIVILVRLLCTVVAADVVVSCSWDAAASCTACRRRRRRRRVLVVVVRQIIAQRYGLHVSMEMLVLAQLGFQIPLGWIANIEVRASRDGMIDHATTHMDACEHRGSRLVMI